MLLGVGIAMTMSPMSTAAMNAVAGREGRDRLRRPLDVPDGRRQPRRRGHRRGLPEPRPRIRLGTLLAGSGIPAGRAERDRREPRQRRRRRRRSPAFRPAQARQAGAAAQDAFVYALSHAMGICAAVTLLGAVVGVAVIRSRQAPVAEEARGRRSPRPAPRSGRRRGAQRLSRLRHRAGSSGGQPPGRSRSIARARRTSDPAQPAIVSRFERSIASGPRRPRGEHDAADLEPDRPRRLHRQQGVVDRAEARARGDHQRQLRARGRSRAPGSRG